MREHLLFNFRGGIGVPDHVEAWSVSLKLFRAVEGPLPSTPVAQSTVDQAFEVFETYFADSRTGIHGAAEFNEVRAWFIGEDGKAKHPVTTQHIVPEGINGGNSGTLHPFQVAVKVSLGAGHNRKGGRGGFYLPCPSVAIQQNGQVPEAFKDSLVAVTQEFLEAMENLADFDPAWVIGWPSTSPNNPDGWAMAERVAVGLVLDTLRSRRRDLNDSLEWNAINRADD